MCTEPTDSDEYLILEEENLLHVWHLDAPSIEAVPHDSSDSDDSKAEGLLLECAGNEGSQLLDRLKVD